MMLGKGGLWGVVGQGTWARRAGRLLIFAAASIRCAGASGQSNAMAVPAKQWATDAALNEIKVLNYEHTYLRYRIHMVDAKGDVVRDVIETRDGPVARLILRGGRVLSADEDAAEHERLQGMLDSPAAFAKHVKNEQNGKKMAAEIMKALPGAMIYSYAAGQPQREHRGSDDPTEIVVDFKPDPGWTPPSMAAEALTGLEGRVWIDPQTHYMTRMECRVFRGINFGLGMLAHIYPGGYASFEQIHVLNERWIFSHFIEHTTVRALMLKTFRENSDVQGSNFTPVGTMNYQDAIHLLLAMPLPNH